MRFEHAQQEHGFGLTAFVLFVVVATVVVVVFLLAGAQAACRDPLETSPRVASTRSLPASQDEGSGQNNSIDDASSGIR